MNFNKDMTVDEALRLHPGAVDVFKKYNMDCSGCTISNYETIEQAACMQSADIGHLLESLNALLEND